MGSQYRVESRLMSLVCMLTPLRILRLYGWLQQKALSSIATTTREIVDMNTSKPLTPRQAPKGLLVALNLDAPSTTYETHLRLYTAI